MMQSLVRRLFDRWELVYSTQSVEEAAIVKEKLRKHDVTYKAKTLSSGGGQGGGYGFASTYQVFVRERDRRKADEAIHHSTLE